MGAGGSPVAAGSNGVSVSVERMSTASSVSSLIGWLRCVTPMLATGAPFVLACAGSGIPGSRSRPLCPDPVDVPQLSDVAETEGGGVFPVNTALPVSNCATTPTLQTSTRPLSNDACTPVEATRDAAPIPAARAMRFECWLTSLPLYGCA